MRKLNKTETLVTIDDMTYVREVSKLTCIVVCVYISSLTQFAYFLSLFKLANLLSKPSNAFKARGWSGGAKVLGKLPVPGRPTIWITVGQGPTALAVGAGGGCLDIFTLIYPFFPLSPSLWETARYRLKYCLKGPLNPKQPTNQLSRHRFCCYMCLPNVLLLRGWVRVTHFTHYPIYYFSIY